MAPVLGVDYPDSEGEFRTWFGTDADCLDYLAWLRWPSGFLCQRCGHAGGWRLGDGRIGCAGCVARTSVTAGTIFDRTRIPLTVWFSACWIFATEKRGVSAQSIQRTLGIGSYQTAWAMLHRLRSVLVRPGRERLQGMVQVDESFFGGEEAGSGGRHRGKKVLVGVAVEVHDPNGFGRCRMAILGDSSAASLHPFVIANVEPGATVITDAWSGYAGLEKLGYLHEPRSQRAAQLAGEEVDQLLAGVHRVDSLAKRWLLGTHQGSVDPAHLQAYLDEFVFRFNRRESHSRGLVFHRLLQLAVGHEPVRYSELIAEPSPNGRRPGIGGQLRTLSFERAPAHRPWRSESSSSPVTCIPLWYETFSPGRSDCV